MVVYNAGVRGDGAYLWQGFDHEWLRTALGFRLPHRISRLDSYIDGEVHRGGGETWRSTAELRAGQAPGVDGNYMRPAGYAAALWAPELTVVRGCCSFAWTDEVVGQEVPHAESQLTSALELDIGELPAECAAVAVLRGIGLSSRCDPDKQPADVPRNSDGMWPYRLFVDVAAVERRGNRVRVPVSIDLCRGWTPMRGGVPGVEEKPLNRRLDVRLDVHVSVLVAPPERLAVAHGEWIEQAGGAREENPRCRRELVSGAPSFYPHAAIGMTGFGFELRPPSDKPRYRNRGRYITGLRFRVSSRGYDPALGVAEVEHEARLWVPATVVQSDVTYFSRVALLQLGADARVADGLAVDGSLCANSSAEAPFFSRWQRCGSPETGPAQVEDRIPLSAP